jgi:F-type H+-transporting ATPase subunit delta
MAELSTLARPYAQAMFDLAQAQNALGKWSDMLQLLAAIAGDSQVADLLDNPEITREQVTDLFIEVAGSALDEHGRNAIKVLAANNRVALLPVIAELFEELKAEAENTLQAEIIAAKPISEQQQQKIADALKHRLGRDVTLEVKLDENLLGGAIVRAGDLVIDGSAKGRLQKLTNSLNI